ncbi:VOC family protein [Peribacillus sp. NPDC096448]|uniref:VOC family protein n=1 Tax=Peribacillus sp. NPDC096448 TaxID=3364395 RepID=UPI00380427FA
MIKPYLMFNRECEEAFKLYIEAFGGELIAMQKYSEIPSNPDFPVEESDKDLVLYSQLRLTEDGIIMGSDSNRELNDSDKMVVSVELNSEEKARKAWNILKEDGSINMDLHETFFAKLHGSLKDKFGVSWMFTVN